MVSALRQLGHQVLFLHIERERGDRQAMRNAWGEAYGHMPYTEPPDHGRRWLKRIQRRLGMKSRFLFDLDEWWDSSVEAALDEMHRERNFEVVIAEYVFFSKVLERFGRSVRKMLDTHDVFSDRHKLFLERGVVPQWYAISRKNETRGLNRADVIFAIQDKEREFFSTLTAKPVVTIGHIVSVRTPAVAPGVNTILFVGSANQSNVVSIRHFIREVLPLIRERMPAAILKVAGGVCDEIADSEAVVKCGRVENLEGLYADATVVVNPIVVGTGLKIKNMEALGYAKPLVTTSIGAAGLEDGIGSAFLVADEPAQFAAAVVELLKDTELNAKLCRRAYDYARARNQEVLDALDAAVSGS